jgi:glutamate-1-semialdehyde 2,1-aminomutase
MFRSRFRTSARLFERAQQILPGGVDSPVRAFKAVGGGPLFVRHASGAHIQDVDGNTYIDYVMSWGPLIHGHAPAGLLKAIVKAALQGTSFGAPTELEIELGELVRERMPSIERIRFVNSGTEACMSAVRLARAATGRDKIVKFAGCYHGHADPFLVQAGSGATTIGVPNSPGVSAATAGDTLIASFNALDTVEQIYESHAGRVAAIIVEPIAGNMGVVAPADGFLQGLRRLCDEHGSLLIFDEVITGFRVAKGGAQGLFGIEPDLTCLGKIIGGGLPVGAYGGRADLMDQVAPAGPVYQAGTLAGNPLAMTAGLWTLRQLTDRLYEQMAAHASALAAGLAEAAREAGLVLQVNGFGSVLTPFFSSQPVRDYRSALQSDTHAYGLFFKGLIAGGVYPPPSQYEAWFLSGAHTRRDIDRTVERARRAMRIVARRRAMSVS